MTFSLQRRTATAALAALGLGAALTAFAPLASAQSVADIKKKGEITIGMLVDFPPYGTTNAQNQPDGYDADVFIAFQILSGKPVNKTAFSNARRPGNPYYMRTAGMRLQFFEIFGHVRPGVLDNRNYTRARPFIPF